MGGQACVLYGAAEFSRDTDIVTVADAENLRRLQAAVEELRADRIAVPPFERRFLEAGHAVHFRCQLGFLTSRSSGIGGQPSRLRVKPLTCSRSLIWLSQKRHSVTKIGQ